MLSLYDILLMEFYLFIECLQTLYSKRDIFCALAVDILPHLLQSVLHFPCFHITSLNDKKITLAKMLQAFTFGGS